MVRSKDKRCNTSSYPFLLLRFIFTPSSLTPLLSPSSKIYNYLITLLCCCFLLMLFSWFSMGPSSSQIASAWVLCIEFRPSGMYCSSMGPFWAAVPARNPTPAWTLLYGLQLLPDHLHQHVLSMGSLKPQVPATAGVLLGLQGENLMHHALLHRLLQHTVPPSSPCSLTLLTTVCITLTSISHRFCTALITLFKIHFPGDTSSLAENLTFGQLWVSFRASWNCLTGSGQPLLLHRDHLKVSTTKTSPYISTTLVLGFSRSYIQSY